MDRLIFHVDVNSAFLSWEAAQRVKNGEPDVRLVPACVSGDPASRRGVVLAKSIPAKKFGIVTGEPVSLALRKCPDLVILKADFRLYVSCSRAFKDICREYAPAVEEFSIDECFLDMSGTGLLYPDPLAIAHTIKDRIRDELGFTVNIGIGRNKLCAKMASDFEKPDKVHTLFPEEIPEKLWPLPVGELLFIGRSSAGKLSQAGIRTIGELAQADPARLGKLLGERTADQARRFANGIDDSPVRSEPEAAKGFSNEVTLEEDVTDRDRALAILLSLCDSVTAHMRSHAAKAQTVTVHIRYADFKNRSHGVTLAEAVDTGRAVFDTARKLLDELWTDKRPLRLMGVALTNLAREGDGEQLSLFEDSRKDREKDRQMDRAVDQLRKRFGSDIIRRGSVMTLRENVGRKYKGQNDSENPSTDRSGQSGGH